MMKELQKGNSIILGDVGTFRMTINSKGAETAEDFDVSLIKKASVRYYPSKRVKNIYDSLTFHKVPNRKTVASALKGEAGNGNEEEGGEDLTD
jgi:predicted histone-like DNA-binding protein